MLLDEAHNLTTDTPRYKSWLEKLEMLRESLGEAQNCTVVGLTATPIRNDPSEARPLLEAIKGTQGGNDEGCVSFFHSAPPAVFPTVLPLGVPQSGLPEVVRVRLIGHNLNCYAAQDWRLSQRLGQQRYLERMSNYCAMGTYYTRSNMEQERRLLLNHSKDFACKLHRMVCDVRDDLAKHGGKAVLMLHRMCGFKALAMLMKHIGKGNSGDADHEEETTGEGGTAVGPRATFGVSSYPPCLPHEQNCTAADVLERFNRKSNDHGEDVAVLVVDAKMASEVCDHTHAYAHAYS